MAHANEFYEIQYVYSGSYKQTIMDTEIFLSRLIKKFTGKTFTRIIQTIKMKNAIAENNSTTAFLYLLKLTYSTFSMSKTK